MFRGIHRIALYELNRRKKKLDAEWDRAGKEAKEKKDESIIHAWYETYGAYQYDDIEWSRKRIVSDSLIEEADQLHLPRPQDGERDKWEANKTIITGLVGVLIGLIAVWKRR